MKYKQKNHVFIVEYRKKKKSLLLSFGMNEWEFALKKCDSRSMRCVIYLCIQTQKKNSRSNQFRVIIIAWSSHLNNRIAEWEEKRTHKNCRRNNRLTSSKTNRRVKKKHWKRTKTTVRLDACKIKRILFSFWIRQFCFLFHSNDPIGYAQNKFFTTDRERKRHVRIERSKAKKEHEK